MFTFGAIFFGVKVSTANESKINSTDYIELEKNTNKNSTISIDFINSGTMVASWYGPKFHGRPTANTEVYDQMAYTAAHKSLPFGTILKVTNPKNGKHVLVRINDRGPYIHGRDIDLSKGAAMALGMIEKGVIKVNIETLVPRYSSL